MAPMRKKGKRDPEMGAASERSSDSSDTLAFDVVTEDALETEKMRAEDLFQRLQRVQAEFDNYRKRTENRYTEITKYASEGVLLRVLDINDDLERALQADFAKDPEAAKKGLAGIQENLLRMLAQEGVQPIKAVGKPFDPYFQHAVHRMNDPEKPDNMVMQEYQRGYMLREKVLRPALVCVNRHETAPDEDAGATESDTHTDKGGD